MPITEFVPSRDLVAGSHPDRRFAVSDAPPSTRKRRAYQVWERPDELWWTIVAEAVEATSRSVAIRQATDGRAGTFATVLVGEWVEETVDDPQGVIALAVADSLCALIPAETLTAAGLTRAQIHDTVRDAVAAAPREDAA